MALVLRELPFQNKYQENTKYTSEFFYPPGRLQTFSWPIAGLRRNNIFSVVVLILDLDHFPSSKWGKVAFTFFFPIVSSWWHVEHTTNQFVREFIKQYCCSLGTMFFFYPVLLRWWKHHNTLFNNLSSPLYSCGMESFISTNKCKEGNDPIHEPKGRFYYNHWCTDLCWTLLGSPCLHFQHPSCPEFKGESRRIRWGVQLLLASKSCTDQQYLKMDLKINKYMKTSTCLCVIETK